MFPGSAEEQIEDKLFWKSIKIHSKNETKEQ